MNVVLWLALAACPPADASPTPALDTTSASSPEDRAVRWLSREVPAWRPQNNCSSCHNNGDAARALFLAASLRNAQREARSVPVTGPKFDDDVLADTLDWLTHPDRWRNNGGDGPFNDRVLADIQFAAALAAAVETGVVTDHAPLRRAAQLVAGHQRDDGSWNVVPEGTLGSPVTYGPVLATTLCHGVLVDARHPRFEPEIARAETWLARQLPRTVIDAAALLAAPRFRAGDDECAACLLVIRNGKSGDGGWGPYVNAAPEPFDTAVVLIGLSRLRQHSEKHADGESLADLIRGGRKYLIGIQQPDGSWPETTRPSGAESYAQRVSTTAWATMALLANPSSRSR